MLSAQVAAPKLEPAAPQEPPRTPEEEALHAEDAALAERLAVLQREVAAAEDEQSRTDPEYNALSAQWAEYHNWERAHPAAAGDGDFRSAPGIADHQKILWLEEYRAMLEDPETAAWISDFLENHSENRSPARRAHLGFSSAQSWRSSSAPLTAVLPSEVETAFLRDPAGYIATLRAGFPDLPPLTPERKTYLRDTLRAKILADATRLSMDRRLPPEVLEKREEIYNGTQRSGAILKSLQAIQRTRLESGGNQLSSGAH